MPQIGQKIATWFSDRPDGKSTILAVLPYAGKYPEMFDCVLRVTAPNTRQGSLEMAYDSTANEHA